VAWLVEVDPEVWAVDTIALSEDERQAVRDTIAFWGETGPPEAVTRFVAGRVRHEYQLANGLVIKFVVEEDGRGGGWLLVQRVTLRYWFPSD